MVKEGYDVDRRIELLKENVKGRGRRGQKFREFGRKFQRWRRRWRRGTRKSMMILLHNHTCRRASWRVGGRGSRGWLGGWRRT